MLDQDDEFVVLAADGVSALPTATRPNAGLTRQNDDGREVPSATLDRFVRTNDAHAHHLARSRLGRTPPIPVVDHSAGRRRQIQEVVLRRSCRGRLFKEVAPPRLSRSGSVRVHDDSGTACESCFKREHRVNVAFQLPPGTIATSIGRHTVRRSVSERRSRVDRARQ
jgi:hypothetical protein